MSEIPCLKLQLALGEKIANRMSLSVIKKFVTKLDIAVKVIKVLEDTIGRKMLSNARYNKKMRVASDCSRISVPRAETEKIVLSRIRGKSGKILEVGCSAAIYGNIFHGDYIGLDLSDLEFPKTNEKHNFLVGTGYNLPFKNGTFDFVLCLP